MVVNGMWFGVAWHGMAWPGCVTVSETIKLIGVSTWDQLGVTGWVGLGWAGRTR